MWCRDCPRKTCTQSFTYLYFHENPNTKNKTCTWLDSSCWDLPSGRIEGSLCQTWVDIWSNICPTWIDLSRLSMCKICLKISLSCYQFNLVKYAWLYSIYLIRLKTAMASLWLSPWRGCPFTARISSPLKIISLSFLLLNWDSVNSNLIALSL